MGSIATRKVQFIILFNIIFGIIGVILSLIKDPYLGDKDFIPHIYFLITGIINLFLVIWCTAILYNKYEINLKIDVLFVIRAGLLLKLISIILGIVVLLINAEYVNSILIICVIVFWFLSIFVFCIDISLADLLYND